MISVIADYLMFIKIFVFLLFLQWLMGNLGNNRFLFIVALLIGGYYIFFAKWTIFGILLVGFVIFLMSGLGNFMQDIIFQYGSVAEREVEAQQLMSEYGPYQMLRRMR